MAYIGQNEDEWNAAQKKKLSKELNEGKTKCIICQKRFTGIKMHLRHAHNMKMVDLPTPTYAVEPI